MTEEYSDYLAHYGVKGQKWGIRRFQNEDGSYTEEGKKRLSLWQRMTHDKKERIISRAISDNRERQSTYQRQLTEWNDLAEKIKKRKNEYKNKEGYNYDLADAKHEAKIAKRRVDAWKRREKWLLSMKVDDLSVRQVKKSTTLKWHEYAYPSEFEKNRS